MEKTESTVADESRRATDERYMRRCLQLAANGQQNAKPNPMVGAVIVSGDGRIIGEGYHVRCGEGHAEVNAFASVRPEDEPLLAGATVYVSLEPCSHWGKTPPCADLIISKGVRRVVCGCIDPFAEVQGRGIQRLREAGIEVTVGVLERECNALNRRFLKINRQHRPYVILKWAQTADGFMAMNVGGHTVPFVISNAYTQMLSHKLRTEVDAIVVGRRTLETDRPQLNVRQWVGRSPVPMVLSHYDIELPEGFVRFPDIDSLMFYLVDHKMQSLLVEGGADVLSQFIDRRLWDELRVETGNQTVYSGLRAPLIPENAYLLEQKFYDDNTIRRYERINGVKMVWYDKDGNEPEGQE